MEIGWGNRNREQQAQGIDKDVAFASFHAFMSIKAADPGRFLDHFDTDVASMIAALGCAFLSTRSRSASRKVVSKRNQASTPCFWLKNWVCFEQKCLAPHLVKAYGKEWRMKTSAFEQWCDRLQLPTATRDFLAHLRSSPPARRVQGRLLNVCGTYASRKMGVSIQFESHTVE